MARKQDEPSSFCRFDNAREVEMGPAGLKKNMGCPPLALQRPDPLRSWEIASRSVHPRPAVMRKAERIPFNPKNVQGARSRNANPFYPSCLLLWRPLHAMGAGERRPTLL